ncbi:hypothetical protein GF407_08910 [candidate division KSB1 bacterium]|nr:hypothetical protein [candidate division KSB1 bacterium]
MQRWKFLTFISFVAVALIGTSQAQLIVKNSSGTRLFQVDSNGKANVADSLKVGALKNTLDNASSLVGVDKHGTLIKSDLSLSQQGLLFIPVDNKILVDSWEYGISADTANAALDIQSAAGITIPDAATHVLIEYIIDINVTPPPPSATDPAHNWNNPASFLFFADIEPANGWEITDFYDHANKETFVAILDGGAVDKSLVDGSDYNEYGVRELQGFGDVVVKLSASKTIAYRLKTWIWDSSVEKSIEDFFEVISIIIKLKGYYVPLAAVLQQG